MLLLNASHDRETGTSGEGDGGMSAREVVQAVRHSDPSGHCPVRILASQMLRACDCSP